MWERTLQDLIRGLRANRSDESRFIAQAMSEIRREVKSGDMDLKAGAILKLTYLDMVGYDMSWASFNVVEVMSSPKYHLKAVGYLAASQSFNQDTDVLMLTTNMIKKDLGSSPLEVAAALNGLSDIATPDLARDLTPELIAMLNHSRAHIRKRAVLALYKVILKYPNALQVGLPRLRDRLDDPDPGVMSATVNVLCELTRRNPEEYLFLAPQLFQILTTSSNNWMLIKIIKLFGALAPAEPRLVKKLKPPISELISSTSAISLLYECVHTCIIGGMLDGPSGFSLAETCTRKLAAFLQDPDQNLKYIALLALVKIVPSHPHLIAEYEEAIIASLDLPDISIRLRALDLISAMVTPNNIQSLVQQLLSHLIKPESLTTAPPSAAESLARSASGISTASVPPPTTNLAPTYRMEVSKRIIEMCSRADFENITDFEWYLSVLVDLAYIASVRIGALIRDQIIEVTLRAKSTRPYCVKLMSKLIGDDTLALSSTDEDSCSEVLWAAGWICGEYASDLSDPPQILEYLTNRHTDTLASDISSIYIQASLKVLGQWLAEKAEQWRLENLPKIIEIVSLTKSGIERLTAHHDLEVQERAASAVQLLTFIQADITRHQSSRSALGSSNNNPEPDFPKSLYLLSPLFSTHEIASSLSASHPVPTLEGIDLDSWIVPSEYAREQARSKPVAQPQHITVKGTSSHRTSVKKKTKKAPKDRTAPTPTELGPTAEELAAKARAKAERLARLRDDPYYIVDPSTQEDDIDSIPIMKLEADNFAPREETVHKAESRDLDEQPAEVALADGEGTSTTLKDTLPQEEVASAPATDTIKVTKVKKKGIGVKKKKPKITDRE